MAVPATKPSKPRLSLPERIAYYKIRLYGTIYNGTQDQVYGTGYGASPQHYAAAADTEGEILTIRNYNDLDVLIAAFLCGRRDPDRADT